MPQPPGKAGRGLRNQIERSLCLQPVPWPVEGLDAPGKQSGFSDQFERSGALAQQLDAPIAMAIVLSGNMFLPTPEQSRGKTCA